MPTIIREEESNSTATVATILIGAVAGFAVGMYVAQRMGGFSGLASKLRPRRKSGPHRPEKYYEAHDGDYLDDDESFDGLDGDDEFLDPDDSTDLAEDAASHSDVPILEERVLEAFVNDPVLSERAIDIGTTGPGDIELEGWVDDDTEAEHAVVIARGVPGVKSVANRLMVDAD